MSTTAVLQSLAQDELNEEQLAYVRSILGDARLDPIAESDLVCPRTRRTIKKQSDERKAHQRHLQCRAKVNTNQRRRRQESTPLTPLEKIRLRKGELPHNLDSKKLSPRQREKIEAILAAQRTRLEPSPADFTPVMTDETLRVPMGKLLNGLELQGVRFVTQVVDGITVFFVDQVGIIPAT